MCRWGPLLQRPCQIGDRGQLTPHDVDQLDCVFGDGARNGKHHGDRLTLVGGTRQRQRPLLG